MGKDVIFDEFLDRPSGGSLDELLDGPSDRKLDRDISHAPNKPTTPEMNRTIIRIFKTLPWKIAPFVLSMFIMVEILATDGWISFFSGKYLRIVEKTPLFPSILFTNVLTSLLCNFMNNQPMTIFFTNLLQDPIMVNTLDGTTLKVIMFALILGSNFGANLTLYGALAGIMWVKICKEKEVEISYGVFLKYGLILTPLMVLVSSAVLYLQVRTF